MEVNHSILDANTAKEHYNILYSQGYMDSASERTIRILCEFFATLSLPDNGVALDFGCGQGIYTVVLKKLLPGWKLYGTDISETALQKASERLPEVHFEKIENILAEEATFDLVFTHHVLEHVQNIEETFSLFAKICKPEAMQVHALPCGNPGSLEYSICATRVDGIESTNGNRFFYEDPTHLRRLTTDDMVTLATSGSFILQHERYMNHYYTALDWIASSSRALRSELLDIGKVSGIGNKFKIIKYRTAAEILRISRSIYRVCSSPTAKMRRKILKPILTILVNPFSKKFLLWFDAHMEKEWQNAAKSRNGSEMFLVFRRG